MSARAALGALAIGALTLTAGTSPIRAHTGGSTGYASIVASGNTIRYSLTLSPSGLPVAVAEEMALLRSGRAQSRDRLLGYIREKVALTNRGRRCEPAQGFVETARAEVESVTLVVDFACASAVRHLAIRDDLFDVLGPDHHTLAKLESSGVTRELAFAAEAREARVTLGGDETGSGGSSFFLLGVEHILTGYDHLLFLAALLLRGGRLLSLLKIVTAFTLAHSLTLALAVLGLVTIPDRLVESVIAASIVWVAGENLILREAPSQRWLVSFLFGLVHGFGFASALTPLALPPWNLAMALLGFNVGVEAGQALVVLLLLPLLLAMRGAVWEGRVVRTASLAVALAGCAWLVERVFFA